MHRHVWHEQDLENSWYGSRRYRLTAALLTKFVVFSTESDGDLICQSGARWEDINIALKEHGIPLFFPVRSASPTIQWFQESQVVL